MSSVSVRKERLDRGIKVRAESLYLLSSWREMTYMILPRAALIVGLIVLPLVMPTYWLKVLCTAGVIALLAISFDFLANYAGLVCLGGGLWTGVGGYIAGVLNASFELPTYLTIPIATLGGAAVCTLLFLPCLPLRGVYFAVVTVIYPIAATKIITALNIWGGTEGLSGLSSFPNVWVDVYMIVAMNLIVLFALRRLVDEDYGLVLRGSKTMSRRLRHRTSMSRNLRRRQSLSLPLSVALPVPICPISMVGVGCHCSLWTSQSFPSPHQLWEVWEHLSAPFSVLLSLFLCRNPCGSRAPGESYCTQLFCLLSSCSSPRGS